MRNLRTYQKKRDFSKTPEPEERSEERKSVPGDGIFVVQKHHASRLHYDFRLEFDGVLLSWAVPKGPSLDPVQKRLAVQTEDHPIAYAEFEGVIPKGEYGAGTMIVWDRGKWQPEQESKDVAKAIKAGSLKFTLDGERLGGSWVLVKIRSESENNWLLIKHDDDFADSSYSEKNPPEASVVSGRTIEEVRDGKQPSAGSSIGSSMPDTVLPQLAIRQKSPPTAEGWCHETKFDGYRILAFKQGDHVVLKTRNDHDWTSKFQSIADAIRELPVRDAIVDGEVCALDEKGVSRFQWLQQIPSKLDDSSLVYFAFDLLWLDEHDVRTKLLRERKALLEYLVTQQPDASSSVVRYSEHHEGNGQELFEEACQKGLEGIVSKKLSSKYGGRRSRSWIKSKCVESEEFIVCGYSEPQGSRTGFGALLLGRYQGDNLVYAGRVGSGFSETVIAAIYQQLQQLERADSPFITTQESPDVTWVNPTLVCEVSFAEWTEQGLLRHAVFKRVCEEKAASEVVSPPADRPVSANTGDKNGETMFRGVSISNASRIVYPKDGLTKGEVAAWYDFVAERMLPYIRQRPLSILRCPGGLGEPCFFQKHRTDGMLDSIRSVKVSHEGEDPYLCVAGAEGIVALAQFGVLEFHSWTSRHDRPSQPDRLVFDLDPDPSVRWEEVLGAAFLMRDELVGLGLKSFLMLTGGKGVHVVVPIGRRYEFDVIKPACKAFAKRIQSRNPSRFVTTSAKKNRKGKIYIDYLRNGKGATAVAPYSLRAREGARIAVPIGWNEASPTIRPDHFSIKRTADRLTQMSRDPWEDFFEVKQPIKKNFLKELGITPPK